MPKGTIAAVVALIAAILFNACKKEELPPLPQPVDNSERIAIKLSSQYLNAAKVDSALVQWEVNGLVQEAKMQLSNDTLHTTTKIFQKGRGRLTVQVFSNLRLNQQKLQWEKREELELKEKASVNLAAPAGYEDQGWFPRIILIDGRTNFTAIVALRPADPYFLLKNVPPGFKIELERNYVATPGGAQIIGSGYWRCQTVCTDARGIIENREFFKPLKDMVGNKPWKMVEVGVGLFGPNHSSGGVLYFNHY